MNAKEQSDKNDEYGPLEAPERFDNATADQKRGAFEWLRAQALTNGLDSFQPALAMHELVRLHREVEQLQVKLAGCSVAALGWNKEPAKRGDYGWSQSYQDVLDLRGKYERTPSATLAPHVDGQDFYELCQQYRHAKEMMPYGQPNVVQAFNNLRAYIKTGVLPWPSYEKADPEEKKCRDCGVRWIAPVPYCPECRGLPVGTPADSSTYVHESKS